MKKTQSSNESKRSIKMLVLFCFVVGFLILGSMCLRLFALIRQSTFDSGHRFTITFLHDREADIVSLDPATKSMSHMVLRGKIDTKTLFSEIGVLSDTVFILKEPFEGAAHVSKYISDAFFHKGGVTSTLSSYDLLRLSLFSRGVSSADVKIEEVELPLEPTSLDILSKELFLDQTIADENRSISIVNGAGVAGLGKRLERSLSNGGFSVISVANADKVSSLTQIVYSGKKDFSVKKLESILGVKAEQSSMQNLSDIIVTLGKDLSTSMQGQVKLPAF